VNAVPRSARFSRNDSVQPYLFSAVIGLRSLIANFATPKACLVHKTYLPFVANFVGNFVEHWTASRQRVSTKFATKENRTINALNTYHAEGVAGNQPRAKPRQRRHPGFIGTH
jgi:hypothetical protein